MYTYRIHCEILYVNSMQGNITGFEINFGFMQNNGFLNRSFENLEVFMIQKCLFPL